MGSRRVANDFVKRPSQRTRKNASPQQRQSTSLINGLGGGFHGYKSRGA